MKIIEKRINNNVVLAKEQENKFILLGKGIGFQVYPGEKIKEEMIEQIFVPTEYFNLQSVARLLVHSSRKEIHLVQQIIKMGEKILEKKLNDNLRITLLDHLHFSFERYERKLEMQSSIEWEIKNMYPKEVKIGEKALELIEKETGKKLPAAECVFIALHFINAQFEQESMNDTLVFTEIIERIDRIITYHFQLEIDKNTVDYQRFLTHIRYYLIRQKNQQMLHSGNAQLLRTVREQFPEEERCVKKIVKYIDLEHGWQTSTEEQLYLILHVNRLIRSV